MAKTALCLLAADPRVARIHLIVTGAGLRLLDHELGILAPQAELPARILAAGERVRRRYSQNRGLAQRRRGARSLGQLSCRRHVHHSLLDGHALCRGDGREQRLVSRAADVSLKEGRCLVLCVRDTPFSAFTWKICCGRSSGQSLPVSPSFYHQPQSIEDLVTQYVCRVLAQMACRRRSNSPGGPKSRKAGTPKVSR